ncbi:hypothetical protein D3C85_1811460 [compost metagenome]
MRSNTKNDFITHSEYGAPTYVVRMCEALVQEVNATCDRGTTLAEVLLLESTCTGADYQRKLTLHCQRLANSEVG